MDLAKHYHIHTVHIFLGPDCCHNADFEIKTEITRNLPAKNHPCIEPNPFPRIHFLVFHCTPPVTGRYLTVNVTTEGDALVLCEVAVYALGKLFRSMARHHHRHQHVVAGLLVLPQLVVTLEFNPNHLNVLYCLLETLSESFGVLREVWFEGISTQDDPILKYHRIFREAANTLSVLDAFDVVPDYSTPYVQRLSTFIQVW